MKQAARRMLSFVLALLICTVGLCVTVPVLRSSAAEAETRFVFNRLSTADKTYPATNAPISLPLDGDPTFVADGLSLVETSGGTNAIFLSIVNASPATELTFTYRYTAYTPQEATVSEALKPNSTEAQTVILHAPYIDSATSFSISFGVESGTVELRSLFNVSVHNRAFEEVVSLDICSYNAVTNSVELSGTIDWETTVLYSGATLALFAFGPSEDIYLSNKIPIARTGFSFSFSFSVPVDSMEDLFYRYIIAAITPSGERIQLTAPYYPSISNATSKAEEAFKGICTDHYEAAVSGGAESATVDVYLDRVLGSQNGGILYAGDHSYYYFDADYVKTIDSAVQSLTDAGCRVYLRFLISPEANDLSFTAYTEAGESLCGKGIYIRNDDALLTVYALTDFLTLRYSGGSAGCISGVILGQTVNRAALYNRTEARTLAEDTEFLAAAFSVVSGASCRNIPGLSVMISLSDSSVGETLTAQELGGEYPADLYLISFLKTLNDYYLSPPGVQLMIESENIPAVLAAENSGYYDAEHIENIEHLLDHLCEEYPNLENRIGYSWLVDASLDGETLQNAYSWLYLRLKLSQAVSTFYLNTSRLASEESRTVMHALSYLYTNINTDRHSDCIASLLAYLNVSTPGEAFSNYSEALFQKRTVYRFSITEGAYANAAPTGSYVLWRFTTATNTLDWYGGGDCTELSVLSGSGGNVLTAHLTFENGFAGISHRFDYGKQLSLAPLLRFEMGINGASGVQYEVQVQLIGPTSTALASAVLTSGEDGVYCLDLSSSAGDLSDVTCIRLYARPLDGSTEAADLYVRSVTLESTIYNDEELKAQIAASGTNREDGDSNEEQRDYTTAIIVTIVVVLASVAIAATFIFRYRGRKSSREAEDRQNT